MRSRSNTQSSDLCWAGNTFTQKCNEIDFSTFSKFMTFLTLRDSGAEVLQSFIWEQLNASHHLSYCFRVVGRKPTISIASCSRSKSCFRSSPSTVKQSCWCQVETMTEREREISIEVDFEDSTGEGLALSEAGLSTVSPAEATWLCICGLTEQGYTHYSVNSGYPSEIVQTGYTFPLCVCSETGCHWIIWSFHGCYQVGSSQGLNTRKKTSLTAEVTYLIGYITAWANV